MIREFNYHDGLQFQIMTTNKKWNIDMNVMAYQAEACLGFNGMK